MRQMSRNTPTVRKTCTQPGASLMTNVHTAHTISITIAAAMSTRSVVVAPRTARPAPRARCGRSGSGTMLACQVIDALLARPYVLLGTTTGSEETYFLSQQVH